MAATLFERIKANIEKNGYPDLSDLKASEGQNLLLSHGQVQTSNNSTATVPKAINVAWANAEKTFQFTKNPRFLKSARVPQRSGWKTIRLFVSSTFHDFQYERDLLVKKIFPDLKSWCQQNMLNFIEIDLRWGIPKGADAELALQSCLGEIDRCYEDNVYPFFLNMTSERVGWIPESSVISDEIRKKYKWIDGLSITEMECLHGAMRSHNPNALFMLRDPSFLQTLPQEMKKYFIDTVPNATQKCLKFREMISKRFHRNQVITYYAKYDGSIDASGLPKLEGFEELFKDKILTFFKQNILQQYPKVSETLEENKWERIASDHGMFQKSESSAIGPLPVWDKQIADLLKYINSENDNQPYVLYAKSGSGKSSCLSVFLDEVASHNAEFSVFCHFTGALSGSVSYAHLLARLRDFYNLHADENNDDATDVRNAIANSEFPAIIAIDAYNQLTQKLVTWIPYPLPINVKIIITCGLESGVHKSISLEYNHPIILKELIPIDYDGKKKMVRETLKKYNKQLDDEQMDLLLQKKSSTTYYWLSLACEELRVFGHFSLLTDKIRKLPDDLVEFQCEILQRFESEQKSDDLLIATLCFIVVSETGLLEVELLELLAEPPNLLPPQLRGNRYAPRLSINKWSEIFRDIRPFVHPMGDASEGRLKIYHKTFGEAIHRRYFDNNDENYEWFHKKLADYFKTCPNVDRKIEEYPFHLAKTNNKVHLSEYLSQYIYVRKYYNWRFSKKLSELWAFIDPSFKELSKTYLHLAKSSKSVPLEFDTIINILMLAFICCQNEQYRACLDIVEDCQFDEKANATCTAELNFLKCKSQFYCSLENGNLNSNDEIEKSLINSFECAQELKHIEKFAMISGKICGLLCHYFLIRHSHDKSDELLQKFIEWRGKAVEIYNDLDNQIDIALLDTLFAAFAEDSDECLKYIKKAEDILIKYCGGNHFALVNLNLTKGTYFHQQNNTDQAKQCFKRAYDISVIEYGDLHPQTQRALHSLNSL